MLQGAGLRGLRLPDKLPPVSVPQQTAATPAAAKPADTAAPPAERAAALAALQAKAEACRLCQIGHERNKLVFGTGNMNADLVFVGEAPGADEDRIGLPFVGRAGKLLDKMIAYLGLTREQVYILNTLKCRPPGNRNPMPQELDNCKPFFDGQLAALKPKAIVALGTFAAKRLLNTEETIGRLRGRFHDYQGIPVMPTYHPAFLLRSPTPENRGRVKEDLRKVATTYLGIMQFSE